MSNKDNKANATPANSEKPKRVVHRRTAEEIAADFQKKIDYHKQCIATLEQKKAKALMPSKGQQVKNVIANALASGLTMEEIAARLSASPAADTTNNGDAT